MFKEQLQKDLDVFLNSTEFGTTALFNNVSIVVDFRSASDVVFDRGGIHDVSASVPACFCKESDVQDIENGDSIIIDGFIFYVLDIDPPTSGIQKIYLTKDRP